MAHRFTTSYLEDSLVIFRQYKQLAERAMAQVSDVHLNEALDREMNSIAITVKHMAGNMRSRWTDFLTSDGEKPDRNRDTEFEDAPATRQELLALWEAGWRHLFDALESLTDSDLGRVVTIRGEKHSAMQAIQRQVAHYSYHCGQIVLLAKHFRGHQWESLSVPRGKSEEFIAGFSKGSGVFKVSPAPRFEQSLRAGPERLRNVRRGAGTRESAGLTCPGLHALDIPGFSSGVAHS